MPKVRKLTGNFIEILKATYPLMKQFYPTEEDFVENFTAASSAPSSQILKDANRDQFLSTNDRTYEEYVADWLAPSVSTAYNQGNANGAFFGNLLLTLYIQLAPHFEEQETAKDAPDRKTERLLYSQKDCKQSIGLSYFNDDGVLCGISIDYSTLDPNLWMISLIRNTTAAPKDREVLLISSAEIFALGSKGLISANNSEKAILDFLKSKTLSQQIKDCGLFTKNGTLDLANVNKLYKQYHTSSYPYSRDVIERLEIQERTIEGWQLNEQKLHLLKAALGAKRQQKIEALDKWYLGWLPKQKESITVPELDEVGKLSFFRRNSSRIFAAVAAMVTLIGFALVLSGVLAPFGIALIGTTELILGAVGACLAFAATLTSAIKIGRNERRLSAYQSMLVHQDLIAEEIYNKKLANITALTAIEVLPEDEAIQAKNFDIRFLQALFHANLSEEEFAELAKQIGPDLPSSKEQDDAVDNPLVVDETLTMDEEFSAHMRVVEEITQEEASLSRDIDKAIQQEVHAQEIQDQEEHQSDELQLPKQTDSSTHNNLITVH